MQPSPARVVTPGTAAGSVGIGTRAARPLSHPTSTIMRLLRTTGTLLSAAAALAAGGCTFLTGVRGTSKVTVTVSPNIIGLTQTAQAIGTAYDGDTPLSGNSRYIVTYTSRNPNVATVDQARGIVTGVAYGSTYIVGENRGERDSALITVRPIQAVQLIINGSKTPKYRVGAQNGISATAFDSAGRGISDRSVTWTSRNTAVLTVSSIGAVTPLAVGSTYIVAAIDNGPNAKPQLDSALARVTLPPIGGLTIAPNNTINPNLTVYTADTLRFRAIITDSLGNTVTRAVTWRTDDGGRSLIIDQSGLARGITQILGGQAVVRATAPLVPNDSTDTRTAEASVAVAVLNPVDSVRVFDFSTTTAPITSVTIAAGTTKALTLDALDVLRYSLPSRTFRVASDNPGVAAVQPTNSGSLQITAGTAGTARLTINALDYLGNPQGKTSTVTVTVQ
jgi:hypothetical protein